MSRPPAPGPIGSKPFLDRDIAEAQEYLERTRARVAGRHVPRKLRKLKRPKLSRQHHLVIGDSHAHPDDLNHRFEWLGAMIGDRKPDVVVDIGDSADMPSLFGYDQGCKGPQFEGRRYWQDIDAYTDSRERLHGALGGYQPRRWVKCRGNHEYRIDRVLIAEPMFRGVIGPHNLPDEEFGWEVYDYGEYVDIDGVLYTHAFKSPGNGREISGVMPARAMVMQLPGSSSRVQGHSHIFQYYEASDVAPERGHGRKITALHAGCYFDIKSNAHRWAGHSVSRWRAGILELEVEDGQVCSFQFTDFAKIQALYG